MKNLITAILILGMTHAPSMAEVQTLDKKTISRFGNPSAYQLVKEDRGTNIDRERRARPAGRAEVTGEHVANPLYETYRGGSQASLSSQTWEPLDLDDCPCGPDCKCPDKMVCKNGDCKRNYVIFFSAEWCRPCQRMYPRIEELRKAGYIVYVMDVDQYKKAGEAFQIKSLPTTVVMDQGKETHRFVGVVEKNKITSVTKTKDEQTTTTTPSDYNFISWKQPPISKPGFRPHMTS